MKMQNLIGIIPPSITSFLGVAMLTHDWRSWIFCDMGRSSEPCYLWAILSPLALIAVLASFGALGRYGNRKRTGANSVSGSK